MVDKIGYPVEIMNVTYRDELYFEVCIGQYGNRNINTLLMLFCIRKYHSWCNQNIHTNPWPNQVKILKLTTSVTHVSFLQGSDA